jgi:DNA-binding response OmpR family regulator
MGTRAMVVGGLVDGDGELPMELLERVRAVAADFSVVRDGEAAIQHVGLLRPDLILIAIRGPLPGALDAFETCRELRSRSDAVLVIIPEHAGPHDEIVALAVGADHLLPAGTPVDLAMARLRSFVRRAQGMIVLSGAGSATPPRMRIVGGSAGDESPVRIEDGDLVIDLTAHEVQVAGRPVDVTRIEFDLLVALALNPRRVLTRDQLMAAAWDSTFDGSHVLDAHLSRLRCKIGQAGGDRVAHAVRGVGYRLRA